MKKISYFTIALALSVMVACKGKDKKEGDGAEDMEDMTMEQVDENAAEQMSTTTEAATEELSAEDEVFGTGVDDSKGNL